MQDTREQPSHRCKLPLAPKSLTGFWKDLDISGPSAAGRGSEGGCRRAGPAGRGPAGVEGSGGSGAGGARSHRGGAAPGWRRGGFASVGELRAGGRRDGRTDGRGEPAERQRPAPWSCCAPAPRRPRAGRCRCCSPWAPGSAEPPRTCGTRGRAPAASEYRRAPPGACGMGMGMGVPPSPLPPLHVASAPG